MKRRRHATTPKTPPVTTNRSPRALQRLRHSIDAIQRWSHIDCPTRAPVYQAPGTKLRRMLSQEVRFYLTQNLVNCGYPSAPLYVWGGASVMVVSCGPGPEGLARLRICEAWLKDRSLTHKIIRGDRPGSKQQRDEWAANDEDFSDFLQIDNDQSAYV